MSIKRIIEEFDRWTPGREPLVLATVYATEGSTYSKAGQRILINNDGESFGLISGGCLEGDLAGHAHTVFVSGDARTVTYDLSEEAGLSWGLGVGCDGVMKILLQRLDAEHDYEPFRTLAARHRAHKDNGSCVTVIESEDRDLRPGATLIDWGNDAFCWQMPDDRRDAISNQTDTLGELDRPKLLRQPSRGGAFVALHTPIRPIPRLLILGAGPDATPLVNIANETGWLVTIVDHRQANMNNPELGVAEQTLCLPHESFPGELDLHTFDAAVIMSHNLEADGAYLKTLSQQTDIPYVGLLGPSARRQLLLKEHELQKTNFSARLYGPAGLNIGADSPETIALSIMAEIQQAYYQNSEEQDDTNA